MVCTLNRVNLNPIDIYQYSDMIDYMSNFMTGLNVGYNITPEQQLNLQILNSRHLLKILTRKYLSRIRPKQRGWQSYSPVEDRFTTVNTGNYLLYMEDLLVVLTP